MAYSNQAQLRMLANDLAGTREWSRRTSEVVERLPAGSARTEVEVHAAISLGTIEVIGGDGREGDDLLTSGLRKARAGELHEHAARAYCNLGSTSVSQRRHADAQHWLAEGLEYCIDRDLDRWTLYLDGWQARHLLDVGQPAAAAERAAAVLRHDDVEAVGVLEPLLVLAEVRARSGHGEVTSLVERAVALVDDMREAQRLAPLALARCQMAWIAGDLEQAAAVATDAWGLVSQSDCPWSRGAVAVWLPADQPLDVHLAPPYALERAGRWSEAADEWSRLGSLLRTGAGPGPRRSARRSGRGGAGARRPGRRRRGRARPLAAARRWLGGTTATPGPAAGDACPPGRADAP